MQLWSVSVFPTDRNDNQGSTCWGLKYNLTLFGDNTRKTSHGAHNNHAVYWCAEWNDAWTIYTVHWVFINLKTLKFSTPYNTNTTALLYMNVVMMYTCIQESMIIHGALSCNKPVYRQLIGCDQPTAEYTRIKGVIR